jgi:hypothetical protein
MKYLKYKTPVLAGVLYLYLFSYHNKMKNMSFIIGLVNTSGGY